MLLRTAGEFAENLQKSYQSAPTVIAAKTIKASILNNRREGIARPGADGFYSIDVCIQQDYLFVVIPFVRDNPYIITLSLGVKTIAADNLFEKVCSSSFVT
jgi:hypothetical protein